MVVVPESMDHAHAGSASGQARAAATGDSDAARVSVPGMRRLRRLAGVVCMMIAAVTCACGSSAGGPHTVGTPNTTTNPTEGQSVRAASQPFPPSAGSQILTLQSPTPYTPHAPAGAFDDYHCTVLDPHLTQDSYILGSNFVADSPEVHHAIFFEVPPSYVPEALAADNGGKGWTCFGDFNLGEWLSVWAPGHGLDMAPRGTGFYFPKGSVVIMQVHYNLLVGDTPTRVKLLLQTVPAAAAHPVTLNIDPIAVPPDIPCPPAAHGPLCNRAASLAELGRQFGAADVSFVDELEQSCGRNPQAPPSGDTTSCTKAIDFSGEVLRVQPHMHLLGVGMKVTLDPGTPQARVLFNDAAYDFNYQRAFDIRPVNVTPNDTVEIQCTYNPRLAQLLPQLRRVPPHFVTWGDGSTDEMCLAIFSWIA